MDTLLDAREERTLIEAAQKGSIEARNELILHNQRLCGHIADKCIRPRWMDREDLVNVGILGLVTAIEQFDLTNKRVRFSSYAYWWVRQVIHRCVASNFHDLRTPVNIFYQIGTIQKCKRQLALTLNREPTSEEVSAATGIPLDHLSLLESTNTCSTSLDELRGEGEDFTVADLYVAEGAFENQVVDSVCLSECLPRLSDKERQVIELRFGLTGGTPMALNEAAKVMGVTRQRVHQWERKALHSLRSMLEDPPGEDTQNLCIQE